MRPNKLPKLLPFLCILIFFTACKKEENVSPLNIEGKWTASSYTSKIKIEGKEENTTEDLGASNIYFDFLADGTYKTNAQLKIAEIAAGDGTVYTQEYSVNNKKLQLTFTDGDLGVPLTLTFTPTIRDNEMVLALNKKSLLEDISAMAGTLGVFQEALLQLFGTQALELEYSITLMKGN